MRRNGREEIVFANIEYAEVGSGARGNDTHDFPANEFFPGTGLFHLVADGDFVAGAN